MPDTEAYTILAGPLTANELRVPNEVIFPCMELVTVPAVSAKAGIVAKLASSSDKGIAPDLLAKVYGTGI